LAPALSAKSLPKLQAAISELSEQKLKAASLLLPLSTVIKESFDYAIAQDEPTGKTTETGKWKSAGFNR